MSDNRGFSSSVRLTLLGLISVLAAGSAGAQPVHFCQVHAGSPYCTGGGGGGGPRVIDIADFEACGSEPDNSINIQAAINSAGPYDTVLFSCLSPIQNPVVVDSATHVALVGVSGGGIRLAANLTAGGDDGFLGPTALLLKYCSNCVVDGVTFQSAINSTSPRYSGTLLSVEHSDGAGIYNNTFRWVGAANAALGGAANVGAEYISNTISDTPTLCRGMWIGNSTVSTYEHQPIIKNNLIQNTGHSGIGLVADLAQVTGNVVQNAAEAGIALSCWDSVYKTKNALIENNSFLGCNHGIQSDGTNNLPSPRTENMTVHNNTCDGNRGTGIYVVNASHWTVTGNHCRNNNSDLYSSQQPGTGHGIYVDAADNIVIEGNEFSDTQTTRTQTSGVVIRGTEIGPVTCVTVNNNTISNNLQDGVFVGTEFQPGQQPPYLHTQSVGVQSNAISGNSNCGIRHVYSSANSCTCGSPGTCHTGKVAPLSGNVLTGNGSGNQICGWNTTCSGVCP